MLIAHCAHAVQLVHLCAGLIALGETPCLLNCAAYQLFDADGNQFLSSKWVSWMVEVPRVSLYLIKAFMTT